LFAALTSADIMLIGCAVSVGLAAFFLFRALYPETLLREIRERALEAQEEYQRALTKDPAYLPPPRPGKIRALGGAIVERLGNVAEPLVRPKWRSKIIPKFIAMGRPDLRPQDFVAQQLLYALFFGALGLLGLNLLRRPLWYFLPFAVFGYLFPHIWLRDQIKKRQHKIARALPYNIDLLTLSVEAGLDFQAALASVVTKGKQGPLIEELTIMLSEIRLGKTRAEALRNLADRIQMPEVSAFVANLIQADKMGTSLGKVLRIQSTQMRVARTHRAEKLANEAPIKMLLPLIGCIFPTVFAVLFGPLVYRWLGGG
jgi:tight adherence protein C